MCIIPLKNKEDIENAIESLNLHIHEAATEATPKMITIKKKLNCTEQVKEKVIEKRKIRNTWQKSRLKSDKKKLNKAIKELKKVLYEEKNASIQNYLQNLTATETTDYSLWKQQEKLKNHKSLFLQSGFYHILLKRIRRLSFFL